AVRAPALHGAALSILSEMPVKYIALALLLVAQLGAARAADLVYIGSQARQLQALRFDPATGGLAPIGPVADNLRPTWTLAHPTLPVLYAVDDDNTKEGTI